MSDISQGSHVKLILNPGDVYRISTPGVATVAAAYGAPAGTTTITANTQDFGPYQAPAKLILTANSGAASYRLLGATVDAGPASALTASEVRSLQRAAGLGFSRPKQQVVIGKYCNIDVVGTSAASLPVAAATGTDLITEVPFYVACSTNRLYLKFGNGGPLTTGLTDIKISAVVETPVIGGSAAPTPGSTIILPVTWGTQGASGLLPGIPGTIVEADPVCYDFQKGSTIYCRTYIVGPSGGTIGFVGQYVLGSEAGGQGINMAGTFSGGQTNPGSAAALQIKHGTAPWDTARSGVVGFGPIGVYSDSYASDSLPMVVALCDSLGAGTDSTWLYRLCKYTGNPLLNLGREGSAPETYPSAMRARIQMVSGAKIGLCAQTHNGQSQAAIAANWKALWDMGCEKVVHVGATTDVSTSVAGNFNDKSVMSVYASTSAAILAANAWAKSQVGTLYGPSEYYDKQSVSRDIDNLPFVDGTGVAKGNEIKETGVIGIHPSLIGEANDFSRMVAAGWDKTIFK